MHALLTYLVVFLGAGIGGALRHAINVAALWFSSSFPFGTLVVNLLGSFFMGLLAGWFALKADAGQTFRLFLTTGVLGGFTTFSAFSLDTVLLWERGQVSSAVTYVLASVVFALVGMFGGLAIVRAMN
jgi:CrcB protein